MNRTLFVPVFLVLILFLSIHATATQTILPDVQLPLAPPAQSPPYDDEEFFETANATINQICTGETLPVGSLNSAFQDSLTSTYYSLIRMNVSAEKYPQAEKITSFLSYTLTLVEKYSDYEKEKEKFSPVDMGITPYEDLEVWYDAASGVWKNISSEYPKTEIYKLPSPIEDKTWTPGQFPMV